jgi:hypothetical protein
MRTGDFQTGAMRAASILHQPEELDIELLPFLGEVDTLGTVLKAPLLFMVPYLAELAPIANRAYRGKREAVARAEAEGKWQKVLWLHEKPYRMSVFLQVRDRMADRDYWQALGSLWLETESPRGSGRVGGRAYRRPRRSLPVADGRGRARRPRQPRRGGGRLSRFHRPGRHRAPSWTLNLARAEWFARRPIDRGAGRYLASVTVPKASVIAYFGGRNEQEIVLDPRQLPTPRITQVAAR